MIKRLILSKIALIGVFAAMGAILAISFGPRQVPLPNPLLSAQKTPTALPPKLPDDRNRRAVFAETILARPLFIPGRAPPSETVPAASSDPGLPRLRGVATAEKLALAIFEVAGQSKLQTEREGGLIGGWTVEKITLSSATLSRDGDIEILRPRETSGDRPAVVADAEPQKKGLFLTRKTDPHLQP